MTGMRHLISTIKRLLAIIWTKIGEDYSNAKQKSCRKGVPVVMDLNNSRFYHFLQYNKYIIQYISFCREIAAIW